jgi:ketosteroid isomerase-like protein
MSETDASSALRAAADLVAAFGSHDTRRYFDAFAPEATFLFHAEPALVPNRAAYEAMWADWERDGFRVLSCRSVEPRVDLETIIFRRDPEGRWLGVHEHLSLDAPDELVQTAV